MLIVLSIFCLSFVILFLVEATKNTWILELIPPLTVHRQKVRIIILRI